ncbi:hypothetical protein ACLOJK_016384 [Asimina triloba]
MPHACPGVRQVQTQSIEIRKEFHAWEGRRNKVQKKRFLALLFQASQLPPTTFRSTPRDTPSSKSLLHLPLLSFLYQTDMNSPPPTFLSTKRKMGPNQQSIPERVSVDLVDGFKKASPEKDMVMGFTISPRYNVDLLQNCDLPPPAKFFSGDSDLVLRKAAAMMQHPSPSSEVGETEDDFTRGISDDRFSLLRALRLSQTRAREAEKKIVEMSAEKERLSALLLGESLQLFAHKRWLKLLEMEVEYLHSQVAVPSRAGNEREQAAAAKTNDSADGADAGSAWCVALAVCLGIASVGFVLGCSYWF